jgi:predicted permease
VATFLIATLLSRNMGITPGERGSFVQGAVLANLAYVGLPVVFSAVGDIGLLKAGILLGFMVPLINSLAIIALVTPNANGKGRARENAAQVAYQLAINPVLLSALFGILWSLFKIPLPALADRTLAILSQTGRLRSCPGRRCRWPFSVSEGPSPSRGPARGFASRRLRRGSRSS